MPVISPAHARVWLVRLKFPIQPIVRNWIRMLAVGGANPAPFVLGTDASYSHELSHMLA